MVKPLASRSTDQQGRHSNFYHRPTLVWNSFTLLIATFFSPIPLWRSQVFTWNDGDGGGLGSIFIICTFSMQLAKQHWYDNNRNPTDSHTIQVQTLWKMNLFSSRIYTKCKRCFGNQYFIFPLVRHKLLIALDAIHNSGLLIRQQFCDTGGHKKHLGKDGCTTITNANKQISDWQIKQKIL